MKNCSTLGGNVDGEGAAEEPFGDDAGEEAKPAGFSILHSMFEPFAAPGDKFVTPSAMAATSVAL